MAAKPSSPASELADLVTCSICLENFKDARALPCVHSYCKDCLQGLVTPQGKLTCPHCRLEIDVPDGDVSNLKPNFFVNNAVDALGSIDNASLTVLMTNTTATSCCKNHPEKECELFCKDCSKLICYKCVSNWGTCSKHSYESIDTAVKEFQKHIEDFLQKRVARLPSVIQHSAILAEMKAKQSENVIEVSKQISDSFAKHMESLKQRQDTLVQQAFDVQWKNDDGLSSEVERVQMEQAKIENTIEFCQKILAHENPALFLEEFTQERFQALQTDAEELVSHVDRGILCFQATDSLLTDVISNFGNVVALDESCISEDEKPVGAERPPFQPDDKVRTQVQRRWSDVPVHEPGPSIKPIHPPVVQQSQSHPGASSGSVRWKLYNKSLSHAHVTFEDNGFSVRTKSPRNVAIYGKPGYQRGKHEWKIAVTGSPACPDSLSVGICVGCNGRGVAVTYDWGFRYGHTTHMVVKLDCDAKTVSISQSDSSHTPDVIGFNNPHNNEVHPYFYLPPPNGENYFKITVMSIDGVIVQNDSEQCCIL